jgi:hypothetical protein
VFDSKGIGSVRESSEQCHPEGHHYCDSKVLLPLGVQLGGCGNRDRDKPKVDKPKVQSMKKGQESHNADRGMAQAGKHRSWREGWVGATWVWGRTLGSCVSWLFVLFAADLADCKLVSFPICIYKVLRNVSDQIHLITLANNELKSLTSKFMTTFNQLRGRLRVSSRKESMTSQTLTFRVSPHLGNVPRASLGSSRPIQSFPGVVFEDRPVPGGLWVKFYFHLAERKTEDKKMSLGLTL